MNLQLLSTVLGVACLLLGGAASLVAHGGTADDVQAFGHTLAIAGAIIIAVALIGSAIRLNARKN